MLVNMITLPTKYPHKYGPHLSLHNLHAYLLPLFFPPSQAPGADERYSPVAHSLKFPTRHATHGPTSFILMVGHIDSVQAVHVLLPVLWNCQRGRILILRRIKTNYFVPVKKIPIFKQVPDLC